jgi:hypothetical protein
MRVQMEREAKEAEEHERRRKEAVRVAHDSLSVSDISFDSAFHYVSAA